MAIRKYRKQIKALERNREAFNTMLDGSTVCTIEMLTGLEYSPKEYLERKNQVATELEKVPLNDDQGVINACKKVIPEPLHKWCALCVSSFNKVVCPFVDGNLYPLKKDGTYLNTQKYGRVIPFETEKKDDN